jgi:hypothetical protein
MMPRSLALLGLAACAHAAPSPEAVLRAQTQELLDAVSTGDARVWKRYLDPAMTYVSENGVVFSNASVIAEVTPLPKGISGTLVVATFTVHVHGDTAIVVHEDRERGSFFGVPLSADYRTTDTWRRGRDGWRLIATQVHAVNKDPPAITLSAEQLDEYAGVYRLPSGTTYAIKREGEHLVGQRDGGKAARLAVEVRDVLFVPGQPRSRKVFVRDGKGVITGFFDRREGRDIAWRR